MPHSQTDIQTYKRLFRYVLPYKFRLVFSFLLLTGASACHAAISVVTFIVANGMINKTEVNFSGLPGLPSYLEGVSFSTSWIPCIIVVTFLLRGALDYTSKYLMAEAGLRAVMDIRDALYRHVIHLSCDFFSHKRAGELISRILGDVNSVNAAVTSIIADSIKSPLVILWSIPMVFILGGKLAIYCIAAFPLVVIPIALLGRQLRKVFKKMLENSADITSFLQESFLGIRIIKAFGMENWEVGRFNKINKRQYQFSMRNIRLVEVQRPIIEAMGAVGIALTISFAMKALEPDRFMAFAAALFLLYEPFKKMSKINSTLQGALASGNRIFEVLDQKPSVEEKQNAVVFSERITTIDFKGIVFSYDRESEVLKGVDLSVKRGEIIALVGPSGSGKTTLVNLLPRFYDPAKGEVCFNGRDIRDFTLKSLRDQIGLVTQDTILFNGTIAENIAYGKPEATQAEIEAAARAANAHDFIMSFDKAYATPIGERGMLLSGGQRQRLSIARAILKNPPILIFDEATSHLDAESEKEVQIAIENLIHGRTVFVIAHRLSTIQNANKIVVVENGRIVQEGDHKSLLENPGTYRKLYDLQFQ